MGPYLRRGVASVDLLVKETCNAAVVAARRRTINRNAFNRVIEAALRLSSTNVKMFPQAGLMRSAIDTAYESHLTVYDSLYVALAQTLESPLLSLDSEQTEVARRAGIRVIRDWANNDSK